MFLEPNTAASDLDAIKVGQASIERVQECLYPRQRRQQRGLMMAPGSVNLPLVVGWRIVSTRLDPDATRDGKSCSHGPVAGVMQIRDRGAVRAEPLGIEIGTPGFNPCRVNTKRSGVWASACRRDVSGIGDRLPAIDLLTAFAEVRTQIAQ